MGAAGTDVAIETADVTLMNDDISGVADFMWMSAKVLRRIKLNIFFSMIYNVIGLGLSVVGLGEGAIHGLALLRDAAALDAQLLPVTPTCHWLEYVDWADPVLVEPLRIEKGFAMPSLRPGLGMRWDEKAVKKYQL